MKSFLRSVDVEFEDGLQSINRRYLSFQEEVTLAHRQNLENHMVQQKTADIALRGALCNSERNMVDESGNRMWPDSVLPSKMKELFQRSLYILQPLSL